MEKYEGFKRFDGAEDYSDHHYRSLKSLSTSKRWTKKILEQWRILENNLPETIYVRVYEKRMDLMRAVIIGAQGTPYHDGLFFFDIFFPEDYPASPPSVHHHSHGIHSINPNLYGNGKVCLSLINTWSGNEKERWNPDQSTILQLLLSIQGLVLNTEPYFNEPGYGYLQSWNEWLNSWVQPLGSSFLDWVFDFLIGVEETRERSKNYSEDAFLASLSIMVYTVRKPPKEFEELVAGHFVKYGNRILSACDAYLKGAQIGSKLNQGSAKNFSSNNNRFQKFLEHQMKIASIEFALLADSPPFSC